MALSYQDGLIVAGHSVPLAGTAGYGTTKVEFVSVSADRMTAVALSLVQAGNVATVVIHHRYMTNPRSALALVVSTHLGRERADAGLETGIVTCAARPTTSEADGFVVVPHAVRLADATGATEERTVWEVMLPSQHSKWRASER